MTEKMISTTAEELVEKDENSVYENRKSTEPSRLDYRNTQKDQRNSYRREGNNQNTRSNDVASGNNNLAIEHRRKQDAVEKRTCLYFLEGRCRYGSRCKDLHPGNESKRKKNLNTSCYRECIYFKKGLCRFGDKCFYVHRDQMQSTNNSESMVGTRNEKLMDDSYTVRNKSTPKNIYGEKATYNNEEQEKPQRRMATYKETYQPEYSDLVSANEQNEEMRRKIDFLEQRLREVAGY